MALITDAMKQVLNRLTAGTQKNSIGDAVSSLSTGSLCCVKVSITADATGELAVTIPFDFELVDVIVQARATSGSGTVTVKKGVNAITNAIVMDTDTTITRAGTINDAYSSLVVGDTVTVDTANAADRGLVTLVGIRS